MDKYHIGRLLPPAGQKMTMVVHRGTQSRLINGKWVSSGGRTFSTTTFGSFLPTGSRGTGQGGDPNNLTGDIIEIRVG